MINIEDYGNTTAATIPLALEDAIRQGASRRAISCCWRRWAPVSPSESVLLRWAI